MDPMPAADIADCDLRHHLHQATREAHHRIDHHPLMAPLLFRGLTARAYGNALLAQLCLHRPVERALAAALPEADPLPPRRSDYLVEDLARLGRLAEARSSHWPEWSGTPPADRSAYVGMRYVIEGSTLGGRVIRRQLDLTLPASGLSATRFFDGVAADEPDPWTGFWRLVAALGPIDPETAARAAGNLFAEAEALWDVHLSLRGGRTR